MSVTVTGNPVENNVTVTVSNDRGPAGSDANVTAENIAAAGGAMQADLSAHTGNTSNPHNVTKSQVGLGNADNTSDANKPVSTAQAAADLAAATSPANSLTALQAMDAAQQEDAREAIAAQSRAIGFLDDFGRNDRYSENDTITHMVSTPEVGSAWRLATAGAGAAPKVVSGTFRAAGVDKLFYLGSSVSTTEGRLSLGFVFDVVATQYVTGAYSSNTHNVSFRNTQLLPDGGGINPEGAVHINFSTYGISSCEFYSGGGSTALTCVNATYVGGLGAYPWNSGQVELGPSAAYTLLIEVDGDYMRVTLVGIGSLLFYHADLSTKVGAPTYFWWESGAETYAGANYRYISALRRVFCGAEELNQNPSFGVMHGGNMPSLNSGGPHNLPGQLRLYARNGSYQSATPPLGLLNAALVAGGRSTTSVGGGLTKATGGDVLSEGLFIGNAGYTGVGAAVPVVAAMVVDTNLNSKLSSAAGAETNLIADMGVLAGLNNGDWEQWYLFGELVGTNGKRIRVNTPNGGDLIDSNVSGTPLDALAGFWELKITRHVLSGASHTWLSTLWANGVFIVGKRLVWNGTTTYNAQAFKTTTADAGAITVEHFSRFLNRVNVT